MSNDVSDAQQILDNIDAYLKDPDNLQAKNFTIGGGGGNLARGRSLESYTMEELMNLRAFYAVRVSREKHKKAGKPFLRI